MGFLVCREEVSGVGVSCGLSQCGTLLLRLAFWFEGLSMSCVHRGSTVIVVEELIDLLRCWS